MSRLLAPMLVFIAAHLILVGGAISLASLN